jgi:tetratricopeptide (TPR) repeat protein
LAGAQLMTAARLAVWVVTVGAAVGLVMPAEAVASPVDEARVLNDRATAAFALGRFSEAAEQFEKAFELKPDPALLYNAAQAHRLAGNKERALVLYQSYLRVYGNKDKRVEVDARIRELKEAIAKPAPPTDVPVQPVAHPPSSPPPPAAAVSLLAQPAPPEDRRATSRPLLWVAIGGAVVAAAAVTLLLVVKRDPEPSIGALP